MSIASILNQPLAFHLVTGATPGLRNDAEIMATELRLDFPVSINISRQRNFHRPFRRWLLAAEQHSQRTSPVVVFFENIPTCWLGAARHRVVVPNQEWLRPETLINIPQCREVWCKTRYAERLFHERGLAARYIGFTSKDCFLAEIAKDYGRFIHIPGRSDLKGTATLLKIWGAHPEWPILSVVTHNRHLNLHSCAASNIKIESGYLEQTVLETMMNSAGIHICTSETEGFGHYLNEALSTKAVVITTDGPPMNELVTDTFGVLVKHQSVGHQGLSELFRVDPSSLEQKIVEVINMSAEKKKTMGELARASFIARAQAFRGAVRRAALEIAWQDCIPK